MTRAFLFVTLRTLLNRTRHKLRRLREPRYLVSMIAAVGYLYMSIGRHAMKRNFSMPVEVRHLAGDIIALAVLAIIILAWSLPNHAALEFSEAEIQFLFTAPVSRRQLLLYKLLRSQPAIITTAIILTVIRMPNGHMIGIWSVWTAFSIYLVFVNLCRARLQMKGVPAMAITAAAILLFLACATTFYFFAQEPSANVGPSIRVFDAPITRALLFAPSVVPAALLAPDALMLAANCAILLAVAALLFFGASSLRVPFEELAVSSSEVQAARRTRVRGRGEATSITVRRVPPLFQLRGGVAPEMAVVWKNMIAAMRIASPWAVSILVAYLALVAAVFINNTDNMRAIGFGVSAFLVFYFPIAGGVAFAQDLRLDFRNFDLLKSWPLSGERLLASAVATPIVLVSLFELMFVIGTFTMAHLIRERTFLARPEFIVIALMLAIPVCATQLVIRNALPILFPAWATKSKEEQRGFAAMGQRILSFILNLFVLMLLIFPAALLSAGGYWLARQVSGGAPAALALATTPAAAVLVIEVLFLIRLLGNRFDALDVATELSPG